MGSAMHSRVLWQALHRPKGPELTMFVERKIIIHSIAEDGLPVMDKLTGRVAFIFDGAVFRGGRLP
jgi:hypothetical protein